MKVEFKKYRSKEDGFERLAVKLTEENLDAVSMYIGNHGGAAFVFDFDSDKPKHIEIKQLNFGRTWGKRDWRVAKIGDYILMRRVPKDFVEFYGKFEFWREKGSTFESEFDLIV